MEPYDTSGQQAGQNTPNGAGASQPGYPQNQPGGYPPQGAPYGQPPMQGQPPYQGYPQNMPYGRPPVQQPPPQGYPQGNQPPVQGQQPNVPPQGAYYPGYPYAQQPYYPQQPFYRPAPPPFQAEKRREKQSIRRIGNYIGLAVIAFVILQNILVLPLMAFGLYEKMFSDGLFYYSFYVFLSILSVALPFVVLGTCIKKEQKHTLYPLRKPTDTLTAVLALPIGMGVCMAANIVTNLIIKFFEVFHIYLKQPGSPDASNSLLGSSIFFIAIAVIPALCEEIGLRGVVLQSLKKYGGVFALVASSVVFGLMHGNMVQIPFAMMVGGIMAYFVLKTNSLWPGILIHFLNNGTSAALELVGNRVTDEKTMLIINAAVIWGWIFIGILSALFLYWRRRSLVRAPLAVATEATHLKNGEKFGAFFWNPGMVVAIVIMLFLTCLNINFGGFGG